MKDIFKILEDVLEEESAAFESIPRPMTEVYVGKRLVFRTEDRETAVKTAIYYGGTIRDTVATKPMTLTVPVKRKDVLTKNDAVPAWIPNVQLAPYCNRIKDIPSSVKSLTSDHPYTTTKGWLYGLEYIKIPAGSDIRSRFGPDCVAEMDDFEGIDVGYYFRNVKKLIVHKVTDTAVWYELFQRMGANLVCKTPVNIEVIDGSTYIHDEAGMHLLKGVPDKDGLLTIAEGVVSVMEGACNSNLNVKKVICPSTLKTVGKNAFFNSGVKDVVFNEGLEVLEHHAFNTRCVMNAAVLPSTLKRIHFNGLNCSETTVPEGCVIDNYSFTHNATATITDKQAADMFFAEHVKFRRKAI